MSEVVPPALAQGGTEWGVPSSLSVDLTSALWLWFYTLKKGISGSDVC